MPSALSPETEREGRADRETVGEEDYESEAGNEMG